MDKSEALSELANMHSMLTKMSEEDNVDPKIIPMLNRLVEFFRGKEQEWENSDVPDRKIAFAFYHTYRNLRLIMGKMQERFLEEMIKPI